MYRTVKGKLLCSKCRPEMLKLVGGCEGYLGRADEAPSAVSPSEFLWWRGGRKKLLVLWHFKKIHLGVNGLQILVSSW